MPYTLPTPAQLKTKLPAFASVPDATIQDAIDEAKASVDESWIEADYQPAIIYLAAHLLALNGVLWSAALAGPVGGLIAGGAVSEAKVGDVMVKLGGSSGGAVGGSAGSGSGLASTPYGKRYLELLRRNHPAVALV